MKVGIVRSGMVGATAGYEHLMRQVGREVVFVDRNAARAEADDIGHAVPFAHPLEFRAGDCADAMVSYPGVSPEILWPRDTWSDKAASDAVATRLAGLFMANFKQYEDGAGAEVRAAAPFM